MSKRKKPPLPATGCTVTEAHIAEQMLEFGCHGQQVNGVWEFSDEHAADMAAYLRMDKPQREYVRMHDWRMRPSPVDTTKEAPHATVSMGDFSGFSRQGGTITGPGASGERHTLVEGRTDDETEAAAILAESGVDDALDHPARPRRDADDDDIDSLEVPAREFERPFEKCPTAGVSVKEAAFDKADTATAALHQMGERTEGSDGSEYDPAVIPAEPVTQASLQPQFGGKRAVLDYPPYKWGGPFGKWKRPFRAKKHAPLQPIGDPEDATREGPHDSLWLSASETATMLGITANALAQARKRRQIPCEVRSGRYYYRIEDIRQRLNMLAGSTQRLEPERAPDDVMASPEDLGRLQRAVNERRAA